MSGIGFLWLAFFTYPIASVLGGRLIAWWDKLPTSTRAFWTGDRLLDAFGIRQPLLDQTPVQLRSFFASYDGGRDSFLKTLIAGFWVGAMLLFGIEGVTRTFFDTQCKWNFAAPCGFSTSPAWVVETVKFGWTFVVIGSCMLPFAIVFRAILRIALANRISNFGLRTLVAIYVPAVFEVCNVLHIELAHRIHAVSESALPNTNISSAIIFWIFIALTVFAYLNASHAFRNPLENQLAGNIGRAIDLHMIGNLFGSFRRDLERQDIDRALKSLDALQGTIELYRAAMDRPVWRLADEVQLAQQYQALMSIRQEHLLACIPTVSPETQRAIVPPLMLERIVQNAIKYAVEASTGKGIYIKIAINCWRRHPSHTDDTEDWLILEVINHPDPPAAPILINADELTPPPIQDADEGTHGLQLTEFQIQQLWGRHAQLLTKKISEFTFVARIMIPWRRLKFADVETISDSSPG